MLPLASGCLATDSTAFPAAYPYPIPGPNPAIIASPAPTAEHPKTIVFAVNKSIFSIPTKIFYFLISILCIS